MAVVAETNSHVDALNLAIQAARRDHGHLGRAPAAVAGLERAFVGDHIVTRHNDRSLRTDHDEPVRNRDRWTVQHTGPDGSLTVTHHNGAGTVTLPADYVRHHVRLGYAATAHGIQGDTVDIGLAVITPGTSHRSLYVAATRGRHENQLLVVADDTDHARDVLQQALTNDRADIPAVTRRRELHQVLAASREVGRDFKGRHDAQMPVVPKPDRVAELAAAFDRARVIAGPYLARLDQAQADLDGAQRDLRALRRRVQIGGPITKVRLRQHLIAARGGIEAARAGRDRAAAVAAPYLDRLDRAERTLERARRDDRVERVTQRLDTLQHPGPRRPAPPQRSVGIDR